MRLLIHNKPKLKIPEFKVDESLSKNIDDPLLSNMNRSFFLRSYWKSRKWENFFNDFLYTKSKKIF